MAASLSARLINSTTLPLLGTGQACPPKAPSPKSRRIKLWQIRDGLQCSIVGTCLTEADLADILKRCSVRFDPPLRPYELHGYFVDQISRESRIAKAVQKRLDRRHESLLRKVHRLACEDELAALWSCEAAAGRIAAAYWSFLTHTHVPQALRSRIFGEVHMLSHVLGRTVSASVTDTSELKARVEDLEARLLRQAQRNETKLALRDRAIDTLKARLRETEACRSRRVNSTRRETPAPMSGRRLQRQNRAVASARERARRAETREAELERQLARANEALDRYRLEVARNSPPVRLETTPSRATSCARGRLRVLYLGGRTGTRAKLREIAADAEAELIHHDGGKEEALSQIDGLVAQCHAVFCPVTCVSHQACLQAKALCRKLDKHFVPLRSAGGHTFAVALRGLVQQGGSERERPRPAGSTA